MIELSIKDYARKLFLELDARGKKVNSLRDIAQIIENHHKKKISYRAIKSWADKGGWANDAKQIKQDAIKKANIKQGAYMKQIKQDDKGNISKLSNAINKISGLFDVTHQAIFDRIKTQGIETVEMTDLIRLMGITSDKMMRYLNVNPVENDKEIIIRICREGLND